MSFRVELRQRDAEYSWVAEVWEGTHFRRAIGSDTATDAISRANLWIETFTRRSHA